MRIKIELFSEKKVVLYPGFFEQIQGFVYRNIKPSDAGWLHDRGYQYGKRQYKLFCFSSIIEKGIYLKKEKKFLFPNKVSIIISSPITWLLEDIAVSLIKSKDVRLGENILQVISIDVYKRIDIDSDSIKVKALTPIEVHSTLKKPDGKKLTYYYSPFEEEFSEQINMNLKRKWEAFYKQPAPYNLSIKPLFRGNKYEKIICYGREKIVIKGWQGRYLLTGEIPFLEFAYDCGIGSRNSQGFGMIEIIN